MQYYDFNAHGDVVQRVGGDSNTAPMYEYDSFGNQKNPVKTDPNPFRYCGEYWDLCSGHYYLRNRYYNPANGRFTQEDVARDGLNWYTYCGNNPIMLIDPTGMVALANIGTSSVFGGIEGIDRQHYGGSQTWFAKSNEEWLRNSACGTIEASNIMAYMAQTQPNLSGLYSQSDMTKSSYLAHQYDVLSKVSPGYITIGGQPGIGTGIWSAASFKAGVISYAKDKAPNGINF